MWPLFGVYCLGWVSATLAMIVGAAIQESKEKT